MLLSFPEFSSAYEGLQSTEHKHIYDSLNQWLISIYTSCQFNTDPYFFFNFCREKNSNNYWCFNQSKNNESVLVCFGCKHLVFFYKVSYWCDIFAAHSFIRVFVIISRTVTSAWRETGAIDNFLQYICTLCNVYLF